MFSFIYTKICNNENFPLYGNLSMENYIVVFVAMLMFYCCVKF